MEQKKNVYSQIQHLLADEPSGWAADSKKLEDSARWLKDSQTIALRMLRRLREMNMSQNDLADKIGVSRQQVNKWLQGRENLTLEAVNKLGAPVGLTLAELSQPYQKKQLESVNQERVRQPYPVSGSVQKENYQPVKDDVKEAKVMPLLGNNWQKFQEEKAL